MRQQLCVFVVTLATAMLPSPLASPLSAQAPRRNVILVTFDGARVEEIFGGLDVAVLRSTLEKDAALEESPTYKRFWAETPVARRERLLPFFWGTLLKEHGAIAGSPACRSVVRLSNRHKFSYPGYAELLLGVAHDDRITSNDAVPSPFPTVLEFLRHELQLGVNDVAAYGSWSVFNSIVESKPGTIAVNAGYEEPSVDLGPEAAALGRMQWDTPTGWDTVRHDYYTFRLAMAHLQRHKPRVLYLALGETDDWAHEGRYDRVLDSLHRSDAYLRELWTWLQAQPEYRGSTSIVFATDHGRGTTPADWKHHGEKYPDAARTWMAFASPQFAPRGEWCGHEPITNAQVAATLVDWMGIDWKAFNPRAAPPVR